VGVSAAAGKTNPRVESLTEEGMILGTPHYMSPEQLEGKHVDVRADVFAFGAVLYEMLTGQKAFSGGSVAAVMAAVLNAEPAPLAGIQPSVPRSLERLIHKCLAKNPDDRWQTARDLADELKWIGAESASRDTLSRDAEARRTAAWARWPVVGALLLVTVGALAGYGGWRLARSREPALPVAVTRFAIHAPAGAAIDAFDLAPDGTAITYVRRSRDGIRLHFQRLDQLRDSPIPGTEGAASPLFSVDGQWIAFFAGGRLLKVNVQTNAAPILISENIEQWLNGATWLADGTIIFARANLGLHRVSAEGGAPVPLTSLTETPPEFDHHSPSILPGGKALLFTLHAHDGRFHIVAETLATKTRKLLIESAYDARYVNSGHLVFARERRILAVPFDVERLEVTGPPVTLVEPVTGRPRDGGGGYRLAANGTLVFLPEPPLDGRMLTWVDRTGAETALPISPRAFSTPSVSPDGTRLAFAVADSGRRQVFIYDIASGSLSRLTSTGDNRAPIWTRDGQSVTYSSSAASSSSADATNNDERQLVLQSTDASHAPERLAIGGRSLAPGSWSAGDSTLVYASSGTSPSGMGLFAVRRDDDRQPQRWADGRGEEGEPSFSPDGRWVAFTSTESGPINVHVAAVSNTTLRQQITVDGGREPKWTHDGRELMYRSFGQMFAVPMDMKRGVPTGKPRLLFDASAYVSGAADTAGFDYDLAPDGRFLMVKLGAEEQRPSLHVVLNWADELRRRVRRGQ
jgi:serine/threonine-protein kinase